MQLGKFKSHTKLMFVIGGIIALVALGLVWLLVFLDIIGLAWGFYLSGTVVLVFAAVNATRMIVYRAVFRHLALLSKSTIEVTDTASLSPIYGVERDDEIGVLARSVQHMRTNMNDANVDVIEMQIAREHQEYLIETVSEITLSLLGMPDNDLELFDKYLLNGLYTISISGEVDAVAVFRNMYNSDAHKNEQCSEIQLFWEEGITHVMEASNEVFDYSSRPGWYERLSGGEFINEIASEMPEHEKDSRRENAQAMLFVPVFFQESFWGVVMYEDHRRAERFSDKRMALLKSAAFMLVSAVHRKRQSERIREVANRMRVMLDAMPISCFIWDKYESMIDTNTMGVKFFNFKSREEAIERWSETTPEFQPDGRPSDELGRLYFQRAMEDGQCKFDWMYRMPHTGELIPCEVTLVRVMYDGRYMISSYLRDVREQRNMIAEIEHRGHLLYTVNSAANVLLQSETDEFESALFRSLSMMARVVEVERVFVWEYRQKDGWRHFNQIYEWVGDATIFQRQNQKIYYPEDTAGFESQLLRGLCISGNSRDLPSTTRESLHLANTRSFLMIPVFLRGRLWGLVGFGDMRKERKFSESDESILRSGGLLVANALLRNEMTQNIIETATKLQAVISNYSGIIWSVSEDEIVTIFNGLTLNKLGIQPDFYEGRYLEDIPINWHNFHIGDNSRKTFIDGPQHWTINIKDYVFSARTAPVYDSKGRIINVVGSIDDVTQSARLQEKLENAAQEARSASQAKSNFLSTMSHEMRTPMNAIIGMSSVGRDADSIERKDYAFERIGAASNHLLGVINDVLDMSKIEAGMLSLSNDAFYLDRTIGKVMNVLNFRIDEKNQQFIIDIDKEIPNIIVADDQRLVQVLTNLLSNAIKFTPENKKIRLEAQLLEKGESLCRLQFNVIDQGIGLSWEQQGTLFKAFVQAEANTTRKYGGTGLGLAISKHIIELMGGTIWINSELGKGATFSFTIEAALPDEDAIAALRSVEHHTSESLEFPARCLLLAEDVDINREIIIAILEDSQLKIICAENGAEALRIFSASPEAFDLILMDVHMPVMDGYEATRRIRSLGHPCAITVPIVAMTANVFREDIEKCMEAGMNAHLGKPLDFDAVRDTLKRFLLPQSTSPPSTKSPTPAHTS